MGRVIYWVKGSEAVFMKLPPQRGEGEKWEGVQILELGTQNL